MEEVNSLSFRVQRLEERMQNLTDPDPEIGTIAKIDRKLERLHDFKVNVYLFLTFIAGTGVMNLAPLIKTYFAGH